MSMLWRCPFRRVFFSSCPFSFVIYLSVARLALYNSNTPFMGPEYLNPTDHIGFALCVCVVAAFFSPRLFRLVSAALDRAQTIKKFQQCLDENEKGFFLVAPLFCSVHCCNCRISASPIENYYKIP